MTDVAQASPPSLPPSLRLLAQQPDSFAWKKSLLALAGVLVARLHAEVGWPAPKGVRRTDFKHDEHDYREFGDNEVTLKAFKVFPGQDVVARLHRQYAGASATRAAWSLPLSRAKACQPLRELPGAAQLVVLLALVPHLQPGLLDQLVQEALPDGGELPALGSVRGTHHRGVLPTGETALYLLAGSDLGARQAAWFDVFGPDQPLARAGLLTLAEVPAGEPALSGRLVLAPQVLERLATGHASGPRFGPDFPAQRLRTRLDWDDLVLLPATRTALGDIGHWARHQDDLRRHWGLGRHLKPGYRVLFYGPPGTGKSLTATLLGKHTGREVYRVDLSLVTSKYIGETEKNLGRLFDQAQARNWILFFDEADALFGKRTDTTDAHDRFANQEVAYLLQKVEEFDGLVILASNLKGNIDPAFARRFQAMVNFPLPGVSERLALWERTLPPAERRADDLSPEQLAARYELSGAAILNVVQFAILRTLGRVATPTTPPELAALRTERQQLRQQLRPYLTKHGKRKGDVPVEAEPAKVEDKPKKESFKKEEEEAEDSTFDLFATKKEINRRAEARAEKTRVEKAAAEKAAAEKAESRKVKLMPGELNELRKRLLELDERIQKLAATHRADDGQAARLQLSDVLEGIRLEYGKDGRLL